MKRSGKVLVMSLASLVVGTMATACLAGGNGRSRGNHGQSQGSGMHGSHVAQQANVTRHFPAGKLTGANNQANYASRGHDNSQHHKPAHSAIFSGGSHPNPLKKCFPSAPGGYPTTSGCKVPPVVGGCWKYPPYADHCGNSLRPQFVWVPPFCAPPVCPPVCPPVIVEVPAPPVGPPQPPVVVDEISLDEQPSPLDAGEAQGLPTDSGEVPVDRDHQDPNTQPGRNEEPRPLPVRVGGTFDLQDPNLGEEPGQVVLQLEQVALPVLVREWKAGKVTGTLPQFGLAGPTKAALFLVRADGQVANAVPIELLPAHPAAAPQRPLSESPSNQIRQSGTLQ